MKIKRIIIILGLIMFFSTLGCYKQYKNYKIKEYSISNSMGVTSVAAEFDLLGIELTVKGKVENEDIKISENLLKISKNNNSNATVIAIAGEMKRGTKIADIYGNIEIISARVISKMDNTKDSLLSTDSQTDKGNIIKVNRAGEVLLGDFDSSGLVDLKDFIVFAKSYGNYNSKFDIAPAMQGTGVWDGIFCYSTPDATVNLSDFIVFARNYGKTQVAIVVSLNTILHKASSYMIGINRNHVPADFPNGEAKLQKIKELTPNWGQRRILYRNGHGPTDGRLDYSYMTGYHFESCFGNNLSYPFDTNAKYPYDDLRNPLSEANKIGADQLHVINYGTGDENEAGRYVSFLNRANDTNRLTHPYTQQNVELFELGNEITWDAVRGHDPYAMNETIYATRGKLFAQKMREASDVPIKVGLSISVNSSFTATHWPNSVDVSMQNMINIMGTDLDFFTYHGYSGWPMKKAYAGDSASILDRQESMATIFSQLAYGSRIIEGKIRPLLEKYNKTSGRDLFLMNSEFFSNIYENPSLSRGQYGALFSAATVVQAMRNDIRGTVNFCLSHGDIADSLMFINNDPNQTTAVYKFMHILANHWGDNIVESHGAYIPSKIFTNNGQTVELSRLQFSSAISNGKLYIIAVNVLTDADVVANINLPVKPKSVTAYELAGDEGYFSDSSKVKESTIVSPNIYSYIFKPASVTIFEMNL